MQRMEVHKVVMIRTLLFSIMINRMFKDIQNSTGVASFREWSDMEKGRNLDFIMNKMQQALNTVCYRNGVFVEGLKYLKIKRNQ